MNIRTRHRRQGFTLLELLLVLAILVVLASLSTVAVFSFQKSSYRKAALMEITTLSSQCEAFRLDINTYPSKLDDLYTLPSGFSKNQWNGPYIKPPMKGDPWGKPYSYQADLENDRVIIMSSGPDGQEGTDDDVSNQG